MSPAPTAQVEDAYGNLIADAGRSVTLTAVRQPHLAGATAVTDGSGLATFSGLTFDTAGDGRHPHRQLGGLATSAASSPSPSPTW